MDDSRLDDALKLEISSLPLSYGGWWRVPSAAPCVRRSTLTMFTAGLCAVSFAATNNVNSVYFVTIAGLAFANSALQLIGDWAVRRSNFGVAGASFTLLTATWASLLLFAYLVIINIRPTQVCGLRRRGKRRRCSTRLHLMSTSTGAHPV